MTVKKKRETGHARLSARGIHAVRGFLFFVSATIADWTRYPLGSMRLFDFRLNIALKPATLCDLSHRAATTCWPHRKY